MEKRFVAVRYFLVPLDQSLFYKPLSVEERKKLFIEALLQNKEHVTNRGVQLHIRGIHNQKHIYYGKLGKLTKVRFDQDTQTDFETYEQDAFITIQFICDTNKQMMAIEMNSNFSDDLSAVCKWLEAIANKTTLEKDYETSFRAIVPAGDFWQIIDEASKIYSISLTLTSPNLFGGEIKADQAIKDLKKTFNQNNATFKFANRKGNLKAPKKELEPYINYADQGGGHWVTSILSKATKRKKRINSAQLAASTKVDMENIPDEDSALKKALDDLEEFDEYTKDKD